MICNIKWISLGSFLALVFLIAASGSVFTESSVHSWYLGLQKPSWNPPAWVFGPVWTLLYISIAISGWIIYLEPRSQQNRHALWVYGIQLFLNALWSFLFFYLQSPFFGVLDILALFGSVAWVIAAFWPISKLASLLLVPYLIWVGYAATLNVAIYLLN